MTARLHHEPDCAGRNGAQTRYWTFDQNNTGGSFDFDEARGITHHVIIEAESLAHAISRAETIGIYFDGCSEGIDCECCGDRWYEPWNDNGTDEPEIYGKNIRADGGVVTDRIGYMPDGREVCIHPLGGPLEWYGTSARATGAA